jgi:HSP20 family protein
MATLEEIRRGLGRFWDTLSQEWSQFITRTAEAITRFTPLKKDEADSGSYQLARHTPRLGVLASEVVEGDADIVVRLEAPGMEREDFRVQVVEDTLVIRGEKRMQREQRRGHYHLMECAYGSFQRAVPLPAEVDIADAKAKYRNGVLSVTLPKTRQGRRRRVTVEVS